MFASQMKRRFAVWHGVEQRVDVWASAGALAIAVTSIVALAFVGPF